MGLKGYPLSQRHALTALPERAMSRLPGGVDFIQTHPLVSPAGSAANRSTLPRPSVLDAPHRGAGPEPAGKSGGYRPSWVDSPKIPERPLRRDFIALRGHAPWWSCNLWAGMLQ